MEHFKQYLSEGADENEQEAARQVLEGLSRIRLENKVAAVALERRAWLRRRFWRRAGFTAAFTIITGLAFWFFRKKEMTESPMQQINPPFQPPAQPQQTPAFPSDKNEQVKTSPIAKRSIAPSEHRETPLLRSAKPDLAPLTNQLIDTLLRITLKDGSTLYRKNPDKQNGWAEIVEFLRQNSYREAKTKIFNFCDLSVDRECNWLLGIALLEEDKPDEASLIFERITQDPDHHRRKAAKLAVDALR